MQYHRPVAPHIPENCLGTPGGVSLSLLAAALAVLLLSGCNQARPANVILIVVDTLRADHLGCYGYQRSTSPSIDRFAAEGYQFDTAIAQSSWTSPSIASLFTSVYPAAHGVTTFGSKMPDGFETLAQALRRRGWKTAAFSANFVFVNRARGFNRGFDKFEMATHVAGPDDPPEVVVFREAPDNAEAVTNRALKYLEEAGSDPFFLYLHYLDPHSPYDAPIPYRNRFVANAQAKGVKDSPTELFPVLAGMAPPEGGDTQRVLDLYDGEIAFTDAHLGRLFDHLEASGLIEDSIVVLTSDHGEEFYEHGGFLHGATLYREQVEVPLIVHLPSSYGGGRRIPAVVEVLDVGPTILEVLGQVDDRPVEGRSFASLLSGGALSSLLREWLPVFGASGQTVSGLKTDLGTDGFAYSELQPSTKKNPRPPKHSAGLVSAHWHYLENQSREPELFDMESDAAEQDNLVKQRPEIAEELAEVLGDYPPGEGLVPKGSPSEVPLDDADRQRLRALGYAH